MNPLRRTIWLLAGLLSLALGIVGIALPVLPTTPFVLLATFCFARSSKKLHNWLVTHPRFGSAISNWQAYGAISRTARTGAVLTMAGVLILGMILGLNPVLLIIQMLVMGGAATFILTRPYPPGRKSPDPLPEPVISVGKSQKPVRNTK